MDKTCDKEGYRWCPVMKKCMPPDHFKGKGQGMHRGQGKGPMGNPMKEAEDLVDLAFDEGFEIFGKAIKAEKKVEKILDAIDEGFKDMARGAARGAGDLAKSAGTQLAVSGAMSAAGAIAKRRSAAGVCKDRFKKGTPEYRRCMHKMVHGEGEEVDLGQARSYTGRPYDHPKKLRIPGAVDECGMGGSGGSINKGISDGDIELGVDDYGFDAEQSAAGNDHPRKIANRINHVPNQKAKSLYQSIRSQIAELDEDSREKYKDFFSSMMKKFGVNSPAQLDGDQKKKFFNSIHKGWAVHKEGWINEGLMDKIKAKNQQMRCVDINKKIKDAKESIKWNCKKKGTSPATEKNCIRNTNMIIKNLQNEKRKIGC